METKYITNNNDFILYLNQQSFVLISTAFSQPNDIGKLEEKYYKSSITPELMERIVETVDEDTLDILTPK